MFRPYHEDVFKARVHMSSLKRRPHLNFLRQMTVFIVHVISKDNNKQKYFNLTCLFIYEKRLMFLQFMWIWSMYSEKAKLLAKEANGVRRNDCLA
jgi:hypothetical protein